MAKVGRKPIEVDLARIESLAASQLTEKEIFTILGISETTYYKNKSMYPEFTEALGRGRAKILAQISHKAISKASDGDNDMIKFFLERKGGWTKPDSVIKHEGKINHEHSLYTGAPIGPILQDLLDALEESTRGGEEEPDLGDSEA